MKAITIKQPWATLIVMSAKKFETRSWQTKYRGQIAIHAGKTVDKEACSDFYIQRTLKENGMETYEDLPTGVVLAMAQLTTCHKVTLDFAHQLVKLEKEFGDYTAGRYAWELNNVQLLSKPIQAKGQLSLWNWGLN